MKHLATLLSVTTAALVLAAGGASAAAPGESVTLVDTLGTATPETTFPFSGGPGGLSIFDSQKAGPRFVLEQPTVITEIGGFLNNCEEIVGGVPNCPDVSPLLVRIVPANGDGVPDMGNVLATFVLSHDNDPLTFSYESVNPDYLLPSGTYFAMFDAQNEDVGVLLASTSGYDAGMTSVGLWVAWWEAPVVVDYQGAVRVIGRVVTATELVANLIDTVEGSNLGKLGTSLTDKLTTVQRMLDAGKPKQAIENLDAFINQVEAQSGKGLTEDQAEEFIAAAQQIEAAIGS